jgi:hypothetical protein
MANTHGEKELRNDWDSLTASDSTKAEGHIQNLIAEEDSFIEDRFKKGIY